MQPSEPTSLPAPDPASAAHSARAAEHLRTRIAAAGGSISFAEFMHEVLYAPGLGYYSAGSRKFGADGDFVTAPEISPVFGRVLARQCAAVLAQIDDAAMLEFGAGSGRLAADLLKKLALLGRLPAHYRILEVSADLRERQQALLSSELPEYYDKIEWLTGLPETHRGVIVANEVLDALPVERFVRYSDHVAQLRVCADGAAFRLMEAKAPEAVALAVSAIENDLGRQLPDGFVSEVCLAAPAWIAEVAALLAEGLAFLFDYGVSRREYYADERNGGWLRCHFRHRAHNDALILPGIQDLTSWVDFSTVAESALMQGMAIAGYVTQSHFLLNGGLADELEGFMELPPAAQLELSGQVKLLTLPGEMGERFKCLGIRRGEFTLPSSFSTDNRTLSL